MRLVFKLRALGQLARLASYIEHALNLLAEEIERVERGRARLNSGVGVLIDDGPDGFTVTATAQAGGDTVAAEGALVITKTTPLGYDIVGPMPEGVPLFVTWGTAGGVIASPATFNTPIGYVTAAGTRYVWAKIGLSDTVSTLCTSLEFVSDTSPTAYVTGPFNPTTGAPPAFMYVPLGTIVATGEGGVNIQISNAGSGSIVAASHIYNATVQPSGELTFLRMLSWWRTGNA